MTTFRKTLRTGVAAALLLAGITTGVQGQVSGGGLRLGVLWRARLVPCSLEICGGFPQNVATLGLEKGRVAVEQSGLVSIKLHRLTILSTGEIASNKTLEVWVGSFTTGVFEGGPVNPVGTITTDTYGNFNGTIDTGGGVPFAFASGTTVSAQFLLNDPGVRSEFITGFTVP